MRNDDIFKITRGGAGSAKGELPVLGLKGHGLERMARLGLPVPPAFVIGTPHCRRWLQHPEKYGSSVDSILKEPLHWLQGVTGLGFGDPRRPLLVSVRSGAPVSMPGMMDTLLNVGLCDATARGLLRLTGNPRLVWDSYRRLIQSFAEVVFAAPAQPFAEALEAAVVRERVERFQELDYLSLARLSGVYLELFAELTGRSFPQEPFEQLRLAVQAVFASWNSPRALDYRRIYALSDDLCTAVTVQQMVFGNAGGTSGAGVGFTRDPDSGERSLYFDFLFNSQGEDVVSGRSAGSDAGRLFSIQPDLEAAIVEICAVLEKEYRDAQEFEFALQDGVIYLLQTRSAKRTPWASLRMAVDMVEEGLIDKGDALARLGGLAWEGISSQRLLCDEGLSLCQGEPSGIGIAAGPIALDVEAAKRFAEQGSPSIMVREEAVTADIAGLALSAGVATLRGNRTSHAAVVARQLGKACVTGCRPLRIDLSRRVVEFGPISLAEGETITLDSGSGRLYPGDHPVVEEYPTRLIAEVESWRREAGRSAGKREARVPTR